MARTNIAVVKSDADGADPAYVAPNVADGNMFINSERALLLMRNVGGAAHVVTISTPGTAGGVPISEVAVSVPAAGDRVAGPFNAGVFNQTATDAGKVYVGGDHADLRLAVVRF